MTLILCGITELIGQEKKTPKKDTLSKDRLEKGSKILSRIIHRDKKIKSIFMPFQAIQKHPNHNRPNVRIEGAWGYKGQISYVSSRYFYKRNGDWEKGKDHEHFRASWDGNKFRLYLKDKGEYIESSVLRGREEILPWRPGWPGRTKLGYYKNISKDTFAYFLGEDKFNKSPCFKILIDPFYGKFKKIKYPFILWVEKGKQPVVRSYAQLELVNKKESHNEAPKVDYPVLKRTWQKVFELKTLNTCLIKEKWKVPVHAKYILYPGKKSITHIRFDEKDIIINGAIDDKYTNPQPD